MFGNLGKLSNYEESVLLDYSFLLFADTTYIFGFLSSNFYIFHSFEMIQMMLTTALQSFSACNCHGHSSKCQYSEQVAQRKLSLDINGKREGGGVCLECQHNTYGINCEKCRPYYYRPEGVPITSRDACRRK